VFVQGPEEYQDKPQSISSFKDINFRTKEFSDRYRIIPKSVTSLHITAI
jgi:hypothetical protein